jgi:AraC family transcriptional regulator
MAQKLPSGCFPARIRRTYKLNGFALTETNYGPHRSLPKHSHEHACFVVVLQGAFTETYGSRSRSCSTSDLIFRPPEEVHFDKFLGGGGRCLTIEFAPWRLQSVQEISAGLNNSADFREVPLNYITKRLYREFCELDNISALAIEGLILEMTAQVLRLTARKPRLISAHRLEQAKEIIHAEFSGSLKLSAIASLIGTHPVYLAREFRKSYGCTIGEYVRRLRVEFACNELSKPHASLVEIALRSGFCDQSHFSRTFQRLIGITPSKYRALICRG